MPEYEYRCDCEETRVFYERRIPGDLCGVCGSAFQRIWHAPGVVYKADGFTRGTYGVDYG